MKTKPSTIDFARDFHHLNRDNLLDPWPVYERLRSECPVAHSDRYGGFWVLSRYDDIHAVAQDTKTFSSAQGVVIPPMDLDLPLIPFEVDPPRHTELRRLLMKRFSLEAVEALEPFVLAEADHLIDGFADLGRCDLVDDYALPLTSAVFGQLLSLPSLDRRRIADWTNCILERAANRERAAGAIENLLSYLREAIRQRRDDPGKDILGILLTSKVEGEPLTDDELLGMCFTFVLAGLETTIISMGGCLHFLAQDPELRARLAEDPKRLKPFVEEYLRVEPPAHAHIRTVTRDVEMGGQKLRANDKVMLLWASANRDSRQFDDPDCFVADRKPNRHFTFGVGRHRCIGAHLATMEIRAAVTRLTRRFPDYSLSHKSRVRNFESIRGLRSVPVTLF